MTDLELISIAKKSLENSYSPYSRFKVGAALLTKEGKVYGGCNIENISYGATICAERVSINNAISNGERNFLKMAIVSESDEEQFEKFAGDYTFPCGICRQVLAEFMLDGEVILQGKDGTIKTYKVTELIPHSFK